VNRNYKYNTSNNRVKSETKRVSFFGPPCICKAPLPNVIVSRHRTIIQDIVKPSCLIACPKISQSLRDRNLGLMHAIQCGIHRLLLLLLLQYQDASSSFPISLSRRITDTPPSTPAAATKKTVRKSIRWYRQHRTDDIIAIGASLNPSESQCARRYLSYSDIDCITSMQSPPQLSTDQLRPRHMPHCRIFDYICTSATVFLFFIICLRRSRSHGRRQTRLDPLRRSSATAYS